MPSRGVFGIEVVKSIEMKNGLHFSPRRVGKWTLEEEHFAKNLIDQFEAGTLTDCQAGTTLRCYLSRRLNCDPMRISKKFAGKSIGKHTYVSRLRDLPPQSIPSPTTIPVPDLDLQSMGLVSQDPSDSLPLPPVSDVSQVPSSPVPIPSNISIPIVEEKENKKKLQSVVSFDTFTKYHKVQLEESLKPSNHIEYFSWPGYHDNTFSTTNGNNMNISMKKRPFDEAFPCLPDVDVHTTATSTATSSDVGLSIDEDDDGYDHRTVKKQVVQVPSTGSMEVTPSYIPTTTTTTTACDVNGTHKPTPIAWVPVPVIPKQPLNDPSAGKQFTPVSTVPRWDAPLSTWEQQGVAALATPTAMLSSGAAGGIAYRVSPSASATTASAATAVNFPAYSIAQSATSGTLQAVPAAIPCTISDNTSETGTETENMTGTETETGSQTGLLSETMTEAGSQKGLSTETSSESDYNTGTETGYHTETDATTATSNTNTTSNLDNKGWNDVLDILLLEEISPVVDTGLYGNSSLTTFNL